MSESRQPAVAIPRPLSLLLRVNTLQAWRRLCSVRERSKFLSSVIGIFLVGYLALSFWLFCKGLRFLGTFPGLGTLLTERLLFLLFAFLFVLLLFSNVVIGYTNLFRNRETAFLLTTPIAPQTIYHWKFLETTMLASWAFLFLIAPLLAAYGLTHQVEWHFYLMTIALTALFVVLPAVGGAWIAVNLARYLDRRAFQTVAVVTALILIFGARIWLRPEPVTDEMLETRVLAVLDRLLMKTRFAQFPLLPSYWLSASVQQWAEGARAAAGFFGLVLSSHVLFFGYLSCTRMGRSFYEAAAHVQSRSSILARWAWFRAWRDRQSQFTISRGPLDTALGRFKLVPSDVRALVMKDFRVFWRDTTQWGQTLVLFGLLGAYILNLRHFSQQLTSPFWVNIVSFLNLGACSLNLATLTTRFVFPQFSLEGKRLWIVGMAPLGLVRVVKVKNLLATTTSLILTVGLVWLSCYMLKLSWDRTAFFTGAITVMTLTLNGLATGLGALYPNFKEDNPTKIVSGFGGTFCLVLSFLYIVTSVALLVVGSPWARHGSSAGLMFACFGGFATLSVLLGWLPLKLGLRKLTAFEH